MPRHLMLALEGPLAAYGAEMVDARGPVRDWPGASLLTGLLANALGFHRGERGRHQALQDRLRFAVRIDRPGRRIRDFQTAQLEKDDKGWTTRGEPEGRKGATYDTPHIRERDCFADLALSVALVLDPPDQAPDLEALARALDQPARPLFLGRKPCLPSRPILAGLVEADDLLHAFALHPVTAEDAAAEPDIIRLAEPGTNPWFEVGVEALSVTDERSWISGVHGGERTFLRGTHARLAAATGGR
jgi:CRISPR system Cascade subunit CasD